MSAFLLSDSHQAIQKMREDGEQARLQHEAPSEPVEGQEKQLQWPGKHLDLAARAGEAWWKQKSVTRSIRKQYPCVNLLADREIDGLSLRGISFPETKPRQIDVSQSFSRTRECDADEKSFCITPKMKVWLAHLMRMMHGLEGLNLQGISYPGEHAAEVLANLGSEGVLDLAGNAFHGGCCAGAMLATYTALAMGSAKAKGAASAADTSLASQVDGDQAADADIDPLDEIWAC